MAPASARLDAWIDVWALARAVVVLLPVVAAALVTSDTRWLSAALITLSCFVAAERGNLAPVGVLLHGVVSILGFLVLFFAQLVPVLFVVGCALMAAAAIAVSGLGEKLRALGKWIFVPALYVAVETAENTPPDMFVTRAVQLLPYLTAAIVPVIALSAVTHWRVALTGRSGPLRSLGRLRVSGELGERIPYGEAMIAVGLAVATAAAMVEWRHLEFGEWVIWSAVSVVTGDVVSARRKLRDRMVGALFGVPVGIALGALLPHDPLAYGLAAVAAMLTLVPFRHYLLEFAVRCGFVACAMVVANDPAVAPSARVVNVILGGVIGVLFVFAVHLVARWGRTGRRIRRARAQGPQ